MTSKIDIGDDLKKKCRMQYDLRAVVDRYLSEGWEVVSREPITMARIGTKQRIEVRGGLVRTA